MHPDDEARSRPPHPERRSDELPDPSDLSDPRAATDRRFLALVSGLRRDDPRFVRRVSAPAKRWLGRADLMIVIGMLTTVVLGLVPLAVGVHLHAVAPLVVGAVACLVLPVGAPWATDRTVRRLRPLWP